MRRADIASAYDSRADEYVEKLGSVAQMADQDRRTIESWARGIEGCVLDVGCGPGHWSELLATERRRVVGIDASTRFLASARRRFPEVDFLVGDLAALPITSDSVDGLLAWFSIIHTDPDDLPDVLAELARVLRPGRTMLLGYFEGEPATPFDHAVATAHYWSGPSLAEHLAPHGLVVERTAVRHDPGVRGQGDLRARKAG